MARKPIEKELTNSKLLKEYASWIYCTGCGKTVAYLCYVTYDRFDFDYTCACGSEGRVHIAFECQDDTQQGDAALRMVKNRLCCPADGSPLVTFVEKDLNRYRCDVTCTTCNRRYSLTYGE